MGLVRVSPFVRRVASPLCGFTFDCTGAGRQPAEWFDVPPPRQLALLRESRRYIVFSSFCRSMSNLIFQDTRTIFRGGSLRNRIRDTCLFRGAYVQRFSDGILVSHVYFVTVATGTQNGGEMVSALLDSTGTLALVTPRRADSRYLILISALGIQLQQAPLASRRSH